jgi:glycosyltransferase involved in cell wall biosynthesis
VLRSFADPRIKIHPNERNRGHVYSFSRVLSLAANELIVMADQDDIWIPGRLERMRQALASSGNLLLSSNSAFIDAAGRPTHYDCEGVRSELSKRHVANIVSIFVGRRRYYGCAMAMHRRLNDIVLPMPAYVESHDLWIAMAANMARSNLHLEENTLLRRLHGHNASVLSRPLSAKLWSRAIFLISFFDIAVRLARNALRALRGPGITTQ